MLMRDRGRLRAWKMRMRPLLRDEASRGAALLAIAQAARLVAGCALPAAAGAAVLSMSTTSGVPVAAASATSATVVRALVEKVHALAEEGSRRLRR